MAKEFPFGIGADPEFNIMCSEQRLHARNILATLFRNKLTDGSMGFKIDKAGVIGWDGNSATGELRPAASKNPAEVVKNIGTLFARFAEETQLLTLTTNSKSAPVGGHIHLQIDQKMHQNESRMSIFSKRLSSFFIPGILADDPVSARTRLKMNYGQINNWRSGKITDDVWTFEYRAPSGEWLTTPKIAMATLAYVATVFNEILHHPKNFAKANDFILKTDSQGEALQELAMSHYNFVAEAMTNKIKKVIRTFEFYDQYKNEIEYFLKPEKVLADKRKVDFNIIKGWGLEKKIKMTKKSFISEKSIALMSKNIDIETFRNLVPIPYNDDLNIGAFAEALRMRVIAHQKNLNNFYFLFGLRKGVQGFFVKNLLKEWVKQGEQLESSQDLDALNTTFDRMEQRCVMALEGRGIDLMNNARRIFLIGIPFDQRQPINTQPFLETVFSLESEPAQPFSPINLPDNEETRIARIYACETSQDIDRLIAEINHSAMVAEACVTMEMAREEEVLNPNS